MAEVFRFDKKIDNERMKIMKEEDLEWKRPQLVNRINSLKSRLEKFEALLAEFDQATI